MSTTTAPPASATAEESSSGGGRKKLVIGVVLLLVVAAAAYWFVLRPTPEAAPKPGEVVALEPVQINLSGGHYLRLGLALQLTEGAHELDGSKALDAAIGVFSGRPVEEVNAPESRETLRGELNHHLEERYHGEVMEVYFTEYVTQ